MTIKTSWNFNIDQGGTFTDIIGVTPDKKLIIKKVLSTKSNTSYNPIIYGIEEIKKNMRSFLIIL